MVWMATGSETQFYSNHSKHLNSVQPHSISLKRSFAGRSSHQDLELTYICVYVVTYIYIYIYTHVERERDVYVYIYIYIYVYYARARPRGGPERRRQLGPAAAGSGPQRGQRINNDIDDNDDNNIS